MSLVDQTAIHARALLDALSPVLPDGVVPLDVEGAATESVLWASSGAMAITAREGGPALRARGAPAAALRAALAVLRGLVADPSGVAGVDERLLGERAAIQGLKARGPSSAGGAFRLLRAADGWVGFNLARPEDRDLLPALTVGAVKDRHDDGVWHSLESWTARQFAVDLRSRGQVLGLPVVVVPESGVDADQQHEHRWPGGMASWVQLSRGGRRRPRRAPPVVLSLSSLWAGPLAAHLLGASGARVVTVESRRRPDGARNGSGAFHDLLHQGDEMVAFDLPDADAVAQLRALIGAVDLVIDGSRPRAMQQLGIDVAEVVASGVSWLSITGYGRTGPWSDQPAFGDDAAASAGLVAWDDLGPVPAGDAIADPLTGVHAAVAGAAVLSSERAWLVDLAMRDVAVAAAALPPSPPDPPPTVAAPTARVGAGAARPLGADTRAVLREFAVLS